MRKWGTKKAIRIKRVREVTIFQAQIKSKTQYRGRPIIWSNRPTGITTHIGTVLPGFKCCTTSCCYSLQTNIIKIYTSRSFGDGSRSSTTTFYFCRSTRTTTAKPFACNGSVGAACKGIYISRKEYQCIDLIPCTIYSTAALILQSANCIVGTVDSYS
ncbi:hypothetical protein D3C86_699270 [compost metagenome]